MEVEKLTPNKVVSYVARKTTGQMRISRVWQDANNRWWVTGQDKTRTKPLSVRPSQCSSVTRK